MRINEALEQFKNGIIKPYVLFYGEDDYLRNMGVQALLKAINVQTPELNFSVFEERPDATEVARAMETLPFMSESRVVLLKNTDILTSACAAELSNPMADTNMPQSNTLAISLRGKPDRRKALTKRILNDGMMVECAPMKDRELAAFAVRLAKGKQLLLSAANAQLLSEYCGGDLNNIQTEIDKLACVCRGNITKEKIEKYVAKSIQYNVFKLHDYFCAKNITVAKRLLDQILEEDPYPMGVIGLIAGNFRQMLVARACRDAGFDERRIIGCIEEETGAREWAARRAIQNCRVFSAASLRRGIRKLGQLDFNAKHGEVVLQTDLFAILTDIYTNTI